MRLLRVHALGPVYGCSMSERPTGAPLVRGWLKSYTCGVTIFVLGLALATLVSDCARDQSHVLNIRIPRIRFPARYAPCDTFWVLADLHRIAQLPMGIERLADGCWKRDDTQPPWYTRETPTQISDATVREILDRITTADSAYEWRAVDGVVVVRSRSAWDLPHPILTRPVGSFDLESSDFGPAFDAIDRALSPRRGFWEQPTWLVRDGRERPRFHTSFAGGTVLDALNAIVRSRSDLIWTLDYCRPTVSLSTAMLDIAAADGTHPVLHAQLRRRVADFHEHPCD